MDIMNSGLKVLCDDATFISIEESEGVKRIHFLGYGYYVGEPEEKPYRWVDYTGLYCTITEAVECGGASKWEMENQALVSQYIEDLSEREFASRQKKLRFIKDEHLTEDISCGEYYLVVGGIYDIS